MKKYIYLFAIYFSFNISSLTYSQDQGTLVDFNSIPSTGTIMVFAHQDDDAIWMLPWWGKTQKFICAAMPSTPTFKATIDDLQTFLDNNSYGIDYKSNWIHPWPDITQDEYVNYYWKHDNVNYGYLVNDHLSFEEHSFSRTEINKIKAKIEPYIAASSTKRIITHNIWGEYGHTDHKAVSQAVRELAVKYGKDVWMLGSEIINHQFIDVSVPANINYAYGDFDANNPLFIGNRDVFYNHEVWTWIPTNTTGTHKFIEVVEAGVDKSALLVPGTEVTTTGPVQDKPGAFIFNGADENADYLTLQGNNDTAFTIAMWVRPDIIRAMDISKMSEYPSYVSCNRTFYMQSDGRITARVSDGSTHTVTSTAAMTAGNWSHILMTSDGSTLKLYIDGVLQGSTSLGIVISGYATPEFIIGQKQEKENNYKGQVYDVRLYDKVLSESSIVALAGTTPPPVYTINATCGGGGKISPMGLVLSEAGDNRTFTITPDTNYSARVIVDGVTVGAVTNYTFNNITSNHTIDVIFTPLPGVALNKPATAQSFTSVMTTPNKANDADGTNKSYWEANYPPQWWKVDLQGIYNVSSIVVRNYYDLFRYYNYEIWGSLDNKIFTKITEKTNTKFSGESGDTYNLTNTTARFLKVVMTNNSINPSVHITDFRVYGTESTTTHFIDASAGAGGTISPDSTRVFNNGENQTYNITAAANYRVADVKVDGVSTGAVPDNTFTTSYTFSNITANHTIEAVFAPLPGIALNKPATAQSFVDEGKAPGKANDSDRTNSSFWEASPYPQWWQVDLQNFYDISAVLIRNYHENLRSYQYEIWGSLDNVNFTKIAEKKDNLTTTDAGDMYDLTDTTVTARYVKVVMTRNSFNSSVHISDFRVYGTLSNAYHLITATAGTGGSISAAGTAIVPNATDTTYTITPNANFGVADVKVDGVSVGAVTSYKFSNVTANHTIQATFGLLPGIALNKPTACESYEMGGRGPEMANDPDGSNSSYWAANPYPKWWQVDLQGIYDINAVFIRNYYETGRYYQYEIWGSTDNKTFTRIAEKKDTSPTTDLGDMYPVTTTARFLKVVMTNNSINPSVHITDFRVYGTESTTTHFIDASAGAGGTISPDSTRVFNNGENQTYNITAAANYRVADVKVDGVSTGAVPDNTFTTSYTFSNITANHTIEAVFAPLPGIALNKPATAQSFVDEGKAPGKANDSDRTNSSFWEASPYPQWWQVDLQNFYDISAVLIRNYHENLRSYQYEIWGSLDNVNFTKIAEKKDNLTTTDAGDMYDLTDTTVTARYVKVVMTRNSFNSSVHISDFRVYGTLSNAYHLITATAGTGGSISAAGTAIVPNATDTTYTITPNANFGVADVKVDGVSVGAVTSYKFSNVTANHTIQATFGLLPGIALNKPTACESYEMGGRGPEMANDPDGSNSSYWAANPYPKWWQVDLQGIYDINAVFIRNYYEPGRYYQYEIWGSTDNVTFTKISEKKNNNQTTEFGDLYSNLTAKARYIKVLMTFNSANNSVHITDFRVYGTQGKTLNISSVMLEGLYNGGNTMRQAQDETGAHWPSGIADHITVELHDAANYSTIVYSAADVPLSTTGNAEITVPENFSGNYYITIKHRNSIETTTAAAVSFAGSTINQSFGNPANVYGGNLGLSIDDHYLIYGGDVNQDGVVDTGDFSSVVNEVFNYSSGYIFTDVNGDGITDSGDFTTLVNNSMNYVATSHP